MGRSDRGASSIEYALLLSIFSLACLGGVDTTVSGMQTNWDRVVIALNHSDSGPRSNSGGTTGGGASPFQMMNGGGPGSGPILSFDSGQSATSNPNGALTFNDSASGLDNDRDPDAPPTVK